MTNASESSERPLVIVTDFIQEPLTFEREVLGDLADVVALDAKSSEDLDHRVYQATALLVYHFVTISQRLIEQMTNLKIIVRCGAGYDNVAHEFARSRGIDVANVPDYGTEDIADTAIAMVMSLTRGTHLLNSLCQQGTKNWTYQLAVPLRRMRGRSFGIIGVGKIGTAAALRAKALGYEVVFYDPHVGDGYDKAIGIRRVETVEELMTQADVVSCHCLLSDETRHIINDHTLGLMKDGSILVNTSRGAVVDTLAVLRALESGKLAGAGIDVLEHEPPSDDHPLIRAWRDPAHPAFNRLILTPHAAFYSEEGLADMRRKGAENVRRLLLGSRPRNVVN